MSFYVRIPRINGRADHFTLAEWVERSGIGEVQYCSGGWQDSVVHNIASHLRFEREEDAVAYILSNGGEYSSTMPYMDPNKEINWLD